MSNVAEVNAAFDVLWADRNKAVATAPWVVRSQVEAALTRESILALADKIIVAVDKARLKNERNKNAGE